MRSAVGLLLLLGIHLVYARTHSLKYFYTAVSGDINFPELTAVGLIDDGQFMYFDSLIKKAIPKTEWIRQNEGSDYWEDETNILIRKHWLLKNNIQVAQERFNQSTGLHTYQQMYGCEWDNETGATNGFLQEGYDGEDFLSLDLKELRWISPVQQGVITTQKWNKDKALLERDKHYFNTLCIEWLKKYVQFGKSSLEKTVSPRVSLLQKDSSSPVTCHATGFYPSGVTITWMKNGEEHHEDVELGELLPNEDGTFQKTSTLTVTPYEWKNNKFSCLVKHKGILKQASEIRTNYVSPRVSLLQKDSSSPVTCHATGFYPSGVTITWMKNGEEHHEDVELGELLPNEDGTFQKTSTLRVTPDEWKNNKFSCLVKHKGILKQASEIRTNNGNFLPIGIIVGVVAAVVLLVGMAGIGYKIYQNKKKDFKPVSGSDDGSNSSAPA